MEEIKEVLQQKALEIIDQLPDISDEQLEALRNDAELRERCRELLALKGDLYLYEHPLDVDGRLAMLHEAETDKKPTGRRLLRWLLPLSAVAAAIALFFIFSHKNEPDIPAGRVYTASTATNPKVEMTVGGEDIVLPKRPQEQEQRFTMDDYREILSHVDPAEQVAFNVPSGHSSDIALSDGSVVSLHPGSRLAFPAKFTNTERVVKLEGEAYFNVVHDSRPFIVMTNQTETTVLGTEFNINTHDGSATTVTLVKGRVQVKNKNLKDNDKVLLGPGMQTVVKEGTFTTQEQIDTKPYSYWAEGYLFYDNAELQDVMRKVGQMYNMTVEFKNTDIMHLKLRFFAERKAGLDAVINRLNSMRHFHVMRSGNTLFVD